MSQRDGIIVIVGLVLTAALALIFSILKGRSRLWLTPEISGRVDGELTKQLQDQLVPFIVSAEKLWLRPDYLLFAVYWYLEAVIAATAGAGILPPLLRWSEFLVNPDLHSVKAPYLPSYAVIMAIIFVVGRIYIGRAGLEKRAVLAEVCADEFRELNTELFIAATSGRLKSELPSAIDSALDIVKRHQRAGSWPYNPFAHNITAATERRTAEIIKSMSATGDHVQRR